MSGEHRELSKKNPCHLPKYRHHELKNFCLQYRDWKESLILLDYWSTEPHDVPCILKGTPPSNPTERQALARLYYSNHISMVDQCIGKLDPTLAPYILKGVTEGLNYDILRTKGCPCCRETYYKYYRYFFWLLSKERQ